MKTRTPRAAPEGDASASRPAPAPPASRRSIPWRAFSAASGVVLAASSVDGEILYSGIRDVTVGPFEFLPDRNGTGGPYDDSSSATVDLGPGNGRLSLVLAASTYGLYAPFAARAVLGGTGSSDVGIARSLFRVRNFSIGDFVGPSASFDPGRRRLLGTTDYGAATGQFAKSTPVAQKVPNGQFITASTASGASAGLVGKLYVEFCPA